MIAGKVMMDRNAPAGLTDTPQRGYDESKALIARWRGRGRLDYAITPRFAITSTEAQLEAAGALAREYPDAYVQTHLDENHAEIAFVKELFPWSARLSRSLRALWPARAEIGVRPLHPSRRRARSPRSRPSAAVAAFCPTSNLFLGSGLFDMRRLDDAGVRVALATDVGGGTSYSMLQTANEAYKVLQMSGQSWPAAQAFYQMTLGNARALGLEDRIGAIATGLRGRSRSCSIRARRRRWRIGWRASSGDLAEELFVLMMMGDDRAIRETYVAGMPVKPR